MQSKREENKREEGKKEEREGKKPRRLVLTS
jgi:hypothetical protein